jgi:hypothetical protein
MVTILMTEKRVLVRAKMNTVGRGEEARNQSVSSVESVERLPRQIRTPRVDRAAA